MIEVARIRWVLRHQATARLLKFCAHRKNNSRPSMISTCIVTMKSVLTSRSMAINESAVVILSGMATSYRLPTKQGVKGHRRSGLIAVARLAKPYPRRAIVQITTAWPSARSFGRRPDVGTLGGRAKTARYEIIYQKGWGM